MKKREDTTKKQYEVLFHTTELVKWKRRTSQTMLQEVTIGKFFIPLVEWPHSGYTHYISSIV